MNALILLIALFATQAESLQKPSSGPVQVVEATDDSAERTVGMWISIISGTIFVISLFVYQFRRTGKPKGEGKLRGIDMCGH